MTAATAIDATAVPMNGRAAGSTPKSGECFAEILAGANPEPPVQSTAAGTNDKSKQAVRAGDEAAKQEQVASTELVIPPNSIIVANAPIPLPTPVQDLQNSAEVKHVVTAQNEDPAVVLAAAADAVPVSDETHESKLTLTTASQGVANPQRAEKDSRLIALGDDPEDNNKFLRPVRGNEAPSPKLSVPEVAEINLNAPPGLPEKLEVSPESPPAGEQTSVTTEEGAALQPDIETKIVFQTVTSRPDAPVSPTAAPADGSATGQTRPSGNSKEKAETSARSNSNFAAAALDANLPSTTTLPDPPHFRVIAEAPRIPEHAGPRAATGTDQPGNEKVTSTRKEIREANRGLEAASPTPTIGSQTTALSAGFNGTDSRLTPASVGSAVPTPNIHTAHNGDLHPTLPANLEVAPDRLAPDPLPLGTVHAAKLLERLGQSEMHVGLRTLVFGSMEVHTFIRGSQVGLSIGAEKGDLHSLLAPEVGTLSANIQQHELKLEAIHFFDPSCSFNAHDFSGTRQDPRSFHNPRFSMPAANVEPPAPEITETLASATPGTGLSVHA